MRIRRLPIQRIGVVVAVLMLVSATPVQAKISTAKGAAPSKLHAGAEPIERSITAGDAVVYTIKLKSGQYCVVKLRQSAIDLVATLTGPDGVRIAVVDTPHWT